jgi:hypothetical protein
VAKPEPITQVATAWNSVTTPKETTEITVQTNDILLVDCGAADTSGSISLAVEGGGLTWTSQKVLNTASNAYARAFTAKATEAKSFKVKVVKTQTGGETIHWGATVYVFRKSSGIGKISSVTNTEGAPSLSAEVEGTNSALVMISLDWAAKTGAATYRTGAGTFTEKVHVEDVGQYTVYGGYHADAEASGAKTVGMTAPGSQKFTMIVVEVKGEEAAGKAPPFAPRTQRNSLLRR